jgi:transporter family-2 protein
MDDWGAMSNLGEWVSVIVVGMIGGIAVGLQVPMSGALSARLGPLGSSLIIHAGGAILSAVLLVVASVTGNGVNLREVENVPKPYLLAGTLGVVLYLTLAFTLPRVGGTVSIALLILAQLTIGLIFDHFGLMGLPQNPLSLPRLIGAGLLIAGAWLVTQ